MKISISWSKKATAGFLALLMAFPFAEATAASAQQSVRDQQTQTASSASTEQNPSSPNPPVQDSPAQSSTSAPSTGQQQNGVTRPVGTAAAPLEKPSGITGSRPAGAVIAPAKQRRARAILIRVGIVVGAAVAVGAVVALSRASPSRPN